MRNRTLWLAAAVAAALALVGVTLAGGPGKKGGADGAAGDKAGCNKGQVGFGKGLPAGAVSDKGGGKAGDKDKGGDKAGDKDKGGPNAQRPGGFGDRRGPGGPGGPGGFGRGQGFGRGAVQGR